MFEHNQIFAAPLAGITDKPFRKILRKFAPNASLVTEMISCHSIVGQHKNCARNFDRYDDEGNIGAQIFGANPSLMGEAARILSDQGAKWIDINMGCPVPKVATRAGAGAFLMQDHKLAEKIMKSVVAAVDIPVSIKTRLGWDEANKNWTDLVQIARDAGIKFATIHGRTRSQGYIGAADWKHIATGMQRLKGFPIVFNGDIKSKIDVEKVEKMGAAGAMIGRALLGRPWLLGELSDIKQNNLNIHEIMSEHLELVLEYYGDKVGVPLFRKHAAWYSSGMKNSAEFRIKINQITDANTLKLVIDEFFNCFRDI